MKAKAILLSLITLICATLGLTACSVEASSPEQPEATAPSAEPDTSNEIQVQVLSEVHSSTTGPNINSTSVTTYYEYDETGRVVSTHQKPPPPPKSTNAKVPSNMTKRECLSPLQITMSNTIGIWETKPR